MDVSAVEAISCHIVYSSHFLLHHHAAPEQALFSADNVTIFLVLAVNFTDPELDTEEVTDQYLSP